MERGNVFPPNPNPSGLTKTCDITDLSRPRLLPFAFPLPRRRRRRRRRHRFHLYFRIDIFHPLRVNLPNNASHRSLRIYAAFPSPTVPPPLPPPLPLPLPRPPPRSQAEPTTSTWHLSRQTTTTTRHDDHNHLRKILRQRGSTSTMPSASEGNAQPRAQSDQ